MNKDNSWVPASGCYPCPLHLKLNKSAADFNPLPGFSDLHRGYFSVPLNSWYLPLAFCTDFPVEGFVMAEVENAQIDVVLAMAAHECDGHAVRILQTQNMVLRIAAANAYEAILDILSTASEDGWLKLQRWNGIIEDIIQKTAFLEELFATLYGFDALRIQPSSNDHVQLPATRIDKLERRFVTTHGKLFQANFADLYKSLASVVSYAGLAPFLVLTDYADDNVDYDEGGAPLFPFRITDRSTEVRLRRGIEIVKALPYSGTTLRKLEASDWLEIFDRWLLDFRSWRRKANELRKVAAFTYALHLDFWRRIGTYNPVDGAILAHGSRTQIKVMPPDAVEEIICVLPELKKKSDTAHTNGRTLVFISATSGYSGVSFLPLAVEEGDKLIPFGDLLVSMEYSHLPDAIPGTTTKVSERLLTYVVERYGHESAEQWARRVEAEREIRKKFSSLLFFEGLRIQSATGFGVSCPMRSMSWKDSNLAMGNRNRGPFCCEQTHGISNLWLAGRKAQLKFGYRPRKWEQPIGCQNCPRV